MPNRDGPRTRRTVTVIDSSPIINVESLESVKNGFSNNFGYRGRKKDALERFIENPNTVTNAALNQLRHTILVEGLPKHCPYRIYVWSILLKSGPIESEWYSGMVVKGAMPSVKSKIENDAFRTFQLDKNFVSKVKEGSLIRLLNVFAWFIEGDQECIVSPYVQGMNVLAGTILYVARSEPEAFTLFQTLVRDHMPRYLTPNLIGVSDGVKLVDLVLERIDPKLFNYLKSKMLSAKIYAFPLILTLSSSVPPLDQVVKLWDFLFSYGIHLNVIFVVARTVLYRDELLKSNTPMTLLRQFPEIESEKIIKLSLSIVKNIETELYDLLVRHTFDESVSVLIDNFK